LRFFGPRKMSLASNSQHVLVVGAGAFGGWTALHLLRAGLRVTLLDAWGPGNSRASSGGETRIIRGTYGPDQPYSRMTARALQLWLEKEKRWGRKLYHRTGLLWFAHSDERFERASLVALREAGLSYEEIGAGELARRYPQVNFEGIRWAIFEPEAGMLLARQACATVVEALQAEGGVYRQAAVQTPRFECADFNSLTLQEGTTLVADRFVFACGPWLGQLFPDVIGENIAPSRQSVLFFGTPGGDLRFTEQQLPIWIDYGDGLSWYGIPGNERRGFKIAQDEHGPRFDPTDGQRLVSAEEVASARKYLALRFPGMQDAPLVETRVCQYENSPDHNFIVDCHPRASNVWIVGGGSGHGFKHGPAVGEMVAELVLGKRKPEAMFSIGRLGK